MKKKEKSALIIPPIPAPRSRSNSFHEHDIDNWITNVFDNAVEEKVPTTYNKIDHGSINIDIKEILENPNTTNFQRYAATNFTGNVHSRHTKKSLKQPLLELASPADQMAAMAIWETILRFMGDAANPQKANNNQTNKSVMSQLYSTISKSFLHSKQFIDAFNAFKDEEEKDMSLVLINGPVKLMDLTIIHRKKLEREISRGQKEVDELRDSYYTWLHATDSTLLDKLHFIIGHGILRATLRDEIYCQLCKQLSDNPNANSAQYGWVLLNLCASCFPPSTRLAPTLLHFMATNGNKLGCIRTLQRTLLNGPRNEPPTSFELNALKNKQSMEVNVNLMDDSHLVIPIDAATTANEVCLKVISHLGLRDHFGFSVFITMFGKSLSMESGGCHILDGVSHCEAIAKEKGIPESEAPWTIRFAKEMFSPWQSFYNDPTAANLIYSQVIKGSSLGEYRCSQEGELAQLVAQHYYVTCGKVLYNDVLSNLIKEVIPVPLLKQKGLAYWVKTVTNTFNNGYFIKLNIPDNDVKLDVVSFAKLKWPILFSKYYEVTQIAGVRLGGTNLLLAINSEGVFFAENSVKIFLKLNYIEIASAHYESAEDGEDFIHLLTISDYKFVFKTRFAEIISYLINWILRELISRSTHVIATQNYTAPDSASFLSLTEGDLVILEEAAPVSPGLGAWFKGYKFETDNIGEFHASVVKVLPTLTKPPKYILDFYKRSNDSKKYLTHKSILLKKHTLETYASRYFRSLTQGSRIISKRNGNTTDIWKYSKSMIWEPLHKGLETLTEAATSIFSGILYYTGDRDAGNNPRHTRTIFEPPLNQVILRDELYCQIMKQLTDNPNPTVEEKAWQLMWLATGLFPCSSFLFHDLKLFLETRPTLIAQESWRRLHLIKEKGTRRFSHHWIEIEAVQKDTSILHKVSFPNGMEQIFKISSFTTVDDLVKYIGLYLGLKSVEGFSLILSYDRNHSVILNSQDYLFDAILEACSFPYSATGDETPKYVYDLMFVKKLWINTYAGVDEVADLVCHYNQELQKYLAGNHYCSLNDTIQLAALIFIAEFLTTGVDNLQEEIRKKFIYLVPKYLQEELAEKEWIENIYKVCAKLAGKTSEEAKILFLKMAQTWFTFGSAFFNVHESSSMQDNRLTLAVNRNGIILLDHYSKDKLSSHPYSEIIDATYTKSSVTIKLTSKNYSWWTNSAYKVADLINSYLEAYDNKRSTFL